MGRGDCCGESIDESIGESGESVAALSISHISSRLIVIHCPLRSAGFRGGSAPCAVFCWRIRSIMATTFLATARCSGSDTTKEATLGGAARP